MLSFTNFVFDFDGQTEIYRINREICVDSIFNILKMSAYFSTNISMIHNVHERVSLLKQV